MHDAKYSALCILHFGLCVVIYLVFTDDWELRGDGSGDIERIQFAPMQRLLDIYDRHGVRGTVMAEVMQQLTFRNYQDRFPELKTLADQWDEHILDAHRRGHDVQLHIHPQWSEAEYSDGKWTLDGGWALPKYPAGKAGEMIRECKAYLESLIRSHDPAYRCRAFRAGASAIGPGPSLLPELIENGIDLDISIIDGYRMNTKNLQIDFTRCDEGRLPYYPTLHDARIMSDKPEAIVCMPLFQFRASRTATAMHVLSKVLERLAKSRRTSTSYADEQWASLDPSPAHKIYEQVLEPLLKGKHMAADVGKLGSRFLPQVLPTARRFARESGLAKYPVVLSNHSKYVNDFDSIDKFVGELAAAPDVKVVPLSEISQMLEAGQLNALKAH